VHDVHRAQLLQRVPKIPTWPWQLTMFWVCMCGRACLARRTHTTSARFSRVQQLLRERSSKNYDATGPSGVRVAVKSDCESRGRKRIVTKLGFCHVSTSFPACFAAQVSADQAAGAFQCRVSHACPHIRLPGLYFNPRPTASHSYCLIVLDENQLSHDCCLARNSCLWEWLIALV
jgi:hypothetical protein